jgi:hypothetical protein
MEYIYFAVSDSHPGMVKIGRTDRPVGERMSELSEDDYGLSGFEGNSTWEAVEVIEVEDNVEAESVLHDHFDSARVEDGREIFYSDDVNRMAGESAELVDGTSVDVLSAGVENSESIFDGADPIFEAGVLEAGDVTDILGEGGDLLEGVLELGAVGIGIAGAAMAYDKYKDERVVKETINSAKLAVNEGRKKWDSSSDTRKEILDKSTETAQEIWKSSSELRDQAETKWDDSAETRTKIVDKSTQAINEAWESSSKFRDQVQVRGEGLFSKIRNKLAGLK